jgi:hypothetical protein
MKVYLAVTSLKGPHCIMTVKHNYYKLTKFRKYQTKFR